MKRTARRLLSLALTLILIGSFFAVSGVAEDLPPAFFTVQVDDSMTKLTVSLYTDGLKWTAIDFGLLFDKTALRLDSIAVGSKITSAKNAGFDFLTMSMDPTEANKRGYANFVAAVGASDCVMTRYAGPIAVYTFTVTDSTKSAAEFSLCISALIDASGKKLLDYTSFTIDQTPVAYKTESTKLFRYGHVNGDDTVSIYDAMLILQHLVGTTELTPRQLAAAHVSGESELSIYDAMLILQKLVGQIETFPAESAE